MKKLNAAEWVTWDQPTPRYTSYPTIPTWKNNTPPVLEYALQNLHAPIQVYVHIPFCETQCLYCGCNMIVVGRKSFGKRYIELLAMQLAQMPIFRQKVTAQRIHLGGGTPTWLSINDLQALTTLLLKYLSPLPDAELSIEADPNTLSIQTMDCLRALGWNRLSLGVQSFHDKVLERVQRPQSSEKIKELIWHGKKTSWHSINIDIMYGLPRQTIHTFAHTLHQTIELQPHRVSVFGYAHVPWHKKHQEKLSQGRPSPIMRAQMMLLAQEKLISAGYISVGFDHFALPSDRLGKATQSHKLYRNFMGYTTMPDMDLIGLGVSAISEVNGAYWQNYRELRKWIDAIQAGQSVVAKGIILTKEDRLRKSIIQQIMCNLQLDILAVEEKFGINFHQHFAHSLSKLKALESAGFVSRTPFSITIEERGRLLVRQVAVLFDEHFVSKPNHFSQSI